MDFVSLNTVFCWWWLASLLNLAPGRCYCSAPFTTGGKTFSLGQVAGLQLDTVAAAKAILESVAGAQLSHDAVGEVLEAIIELGGD